METFQRANLPEQIKYNGETYFFNPTITASMTASGTPARSTVLAINTKGKKAVIVEVLQTRLKGIKDLHGNFYKGSKHIFTNYKY